MRPALACFSLMILVTISFGFGKQQAAPEKPKEGAAAATDAAKPAAAAERKNPVASTPEGLAASKKMFGFDCAMCHGTTGDGKGDMVDSMKLTMHDWHDAATLSAMSDAEIYDIITKGKGKMTGEGDRLPANEVWKMVNYVRSLAKKGEASAAAEASKQ